ncbi:MAG: hypothetical protein JW940_26245 [Polyangiaceae bacterium]|nr:hypothetical protein [Polyangiaceae bacterium]
MASLNPITCRACEAQFSIPDELFKRRLAGRKVIVRCRNCGAHITVDATDSVPPTLAAPLAGTQGGPASTGPVSTPSGSETSANALSEQPDKPPAALRPDERPAPKAPEHVTRPRAVTAHGAVPRLSGQKAKLPPVVPRSVLAPQPLKSSPRASAKSDTDSSEPDNAVVVTAAKPLSLSRGARKPLPPRPGPSNARAADARAPDALAPAPDSKPSSSTRLPARPAAPTRNPRWPGALPAAAKTAPVAFGAKPIAAADDTEVSTVPGFDTDEAPTRPLGADDAPLAPPAASPRPAEPALAEAVVAPAAHDATVGEAPPSSAHRPAQPGEHVDSATLDYPPESIAPDPFGPESIAPDPFGPESIAPDPFAPDAVAPDAVAPGLFVASPAAAPLALDNATRPDTPEADASAGPLLAPNQPARPRRGRRGARWVIGAAVLAAMVVSAALFIRSSAHRASVSASTARESGHAASKARRASSVSPGSSVAPGLPAVAPSPSAERPASAPTESQQKAPSETEPAPTASVPRAASDMPQGLDRAIVLQRVRSVLATAERCHQGGRATGTATVVLTFDGKGHVSEAHIEGEPIASAPVAGCILTYARAIIIPRFSGSPFTLREPITLR